MHALCIATSPGQAAVFLFASTPIMAKKAMKAIKAMKSFANNNLKPMAKARAKAKASSWPPEAQESAAGKTLAAAKAKTKAAVKANAKAKAGKQATVDIKKAASAGTSWEKWADEQDEDEDEDEPEEAGDGKDMSVPTKAQCLAFDNALNKPPGVVGSLPPEVHEAWQKLQRGPGTIPERHALINLLVRKNASYGHIVRVDEPQLESFREAFKDKQRTHQFYGVSESETL